MPPKRRAASPPQPSQTKTPRRAETEDVKGNPPASNDHDDRTPTRGSDDVSNSSGTNSKTNNYEERSKPRSLSALAPEFIPRSASTSTSNSGTTTPVITKNNAATLVQSELPFPSTKSQSRQTSKDSESSSPSKPMIRPVFKSEPLQIKDSTFQARLFSLESSAQTPKILAYMRRQYPGFQHHMSGWRLLVLKPGMTGLEGEDAFEIQQGWDDDGEKKGGRAVMDVIEEMGLCDVVVIVSRRFGGAMLGPVRFTHITDCARAVCRAMYERERAAERASRVADLLAQLREWDTEVVELKLEIAALEPTKPEVETVTDEKGKPPTISVSLKPPDYSKILNPPDLEKAERLLQARKKTVQSLKVALEKKRAKPHAEGVPSS